MYVYIHYLVLMFWVYVVEYLFIEQKRKQYALYWLSDCAFKYNEWNYYSDVFSIWASV